MKNTQTSALVVVIVAALRHAIQVYRTRRKPDTQRRQHEHTHIHTQQQAHAPPHVHCTLQTFLPSLAENTGKTESVTYVVLLLIDPMEK